MTHRQASPPRFSVVPAGGGAPREVNVVVDMHAEQTVLSDALLEPRLVPVLGAIVSVEDFAVGTHASLWRCFLDLTENNTPIDAVTVVGWLRDRRCSPPQQGWIAYLTHVLGEVPVDANAAAHAKRVHDLGRLRRFGIECCRLECQARGPMPSVDEFLADADQRLSVLLRRPSTDDGGGELGATLEATFSRMASGEASDAVSTGFEAIDALTTGMHPGEQWVLAARPGVGKTALALAIATRVAALGQGVVFISLEMPCDQLLFRCMAAEGGVDLSRLRRRQLDEEDWRRLTHVAPYLHALPVWVEDASKQTVFDIESHVRHAASTWSRTRPGVVPRLVIVDYIQLVSSTGNTYSREQEIAEISRRLKALAKTFGVTVLLLAQLNREVEKRGGLPRLSDLRESGSLEQDANLVGFLVGGEIGNPSRTDRATLVVAKQRNGEKGTVALGWTGRWTRYDDV